MSVRVPAARDVGGTGRRAQIGEVVSACIRPERMRLIDPASSIDGGVNGVVGRAAGLIYFGDHVRMRCQLPQQDECFVKVPLGTPALEHFVPGVPVALAFEPEHLRVFT